MSTIRDRATCRVSTFAGGACTKPAGHEGHHFSGDPWSIRDRAREAAFRELPHNPDAGPSEMVSTAGNRGGYVLGYLAAHADLPGREEIARAAAAHYWDRDTGDVETWDELTADEQESVIENYETRTLADAVIALIHGEPTIHCGTCGRGLYPGDELCCGYEKKGAGQ